MSKAEQLLLLAKHRQQYCYDGFFNIGDLHEGRYECNFVSPRSKRACDHNSKVMVVLQDWAGADFFDRPDIDWNFLEENGYAKEVSTNNRLHKYMSEYLCVEPQCAYITNVFPFIKPGDMRAEIADHYYMKSAIEYLRPQVEIIQPGIVICCGKETAKSVWQAFGMRSPYNLEDAISRPFSYNSTKILACTHPVMGRRGWPEIKIEWEQSF